MPGAFLYQNRISQGAIIASSYATVGAMPPSNLLDDQPRTRLRLIGIPSGAGFYADLVVDLLAPVSMNCVALISTVLDSAAAPTIVRVRLATADPTGLAGDAWDQTVVASTGPAANGNVVVLRSAGPATGRYLLVQIGSSASQAVDIGRLVAGPLWRLTRSHAYGIEEGRLVLDRRDRNALTGAEFPVPSLMNPRIASFTLPVMTTAEARGEHRELIRQIGAWGEALWIPDLALGQAELNLRSLWGAPASPGEAAAARQGLAQVFSRSFRIVERV